MRREYIFSLMVVCVWICVSTQVSFAQGEISARFTKIDEKGKELPDDAIKWAVVRDNTSGLYWEVKSEEASIHFHEDVYKWSGAKKKFLSTLNDAGFAGFSDWRLPTSDELSKLVQKGSEPFINNEYFPNTQPSHYLSWRVCGSGEITTEKISFGSEKTKGKRRYVRAVRGGKSE